MQQLCDDHYDAETTSDKQYCLVCQLQAENAMYKAYVTRLDTLCEENHWNLPFYLMAAIRDWPDGYVTSSSFLAIIGIQKLEK